MNGQIRQVARKLSHSHRLRGIAIVLVLIVFGLGLLTPLFEKSHMDSVIKSEWDGVYFAVTTVTGVGYGDMVPVTDVGRVIAMILQTFGVVLFGAIVATVSVELLRYQEDFYVRRMMERLDEVSIQVTELKKRMDFLIEEKK